MARTFGFSRLHRILQRAYQFRDQNVKTDRVHTRILNPNLDRRSLIKRSSIGATCLFIPDPITQALANDKLALPIDDRYRIAIVGAGLAGLHCAYRLRLQRLMADVYEASTRTGGRIQTNNQFFSGGQSCELGGEMINSQHETLLQLAKEFNLPLIDLHEDVNKQQLKEEVFYFRQRRLREDEIVELFLPIAKKIAMAVELGEADEAEFTKIDRLSLSEWLTKAGCDPLLRDLLEETYRGEYGLEPEEQSCFNLFYQIDYEKPKPFRVIGDSDERFRFKDGNSALVQKLAHEVKNQIHYDQALRRIKEVSGPQYLLSFQDSSGKTIEKKYDIVVLAIPFTILRTVELQLPLDDMKRKVINEVGYGSNSKLMLGFEEKYWATEKFKESGSVIASKLQFLWDTSRGQKGQQAILTHFAGGNAGLLMGKTPLNKLVQQNIEEIEKIYPDISGKFIKDKALRMAWSQSPYQKGSYMCYKPGQHSFSGHEARPIGQVFFAGEHTSTEFWGFMEGAAESGARAADEVLAKVNKRSNKDTVKKVPA